MATSTSERVMRWRAPVQAACFLSLKTSNAVSSGAGGIALAAENGALMATGDANGALALWDWHTRRAVAVREGAHCSAYGVLAVAQVALSRWVLSQGRDGRIRCWDWENLGENVEPEWELTTESNAFCRMAASGYWVACTTDDAARICVWDTQALFGGQGMGMDVVWVEEVSEAKAGMCMDVKLVGGGDGDGDGDGDGEEMWLLGLFENGFVHVYEMAAQRWVEKMSVKLFDNVPIAFDVVTTVSKKGAVKVNGVACGAHSGIAAFSLDLKNRKSSVKAQMKLKFQRNAAKQEGAEEEAPEEQQGFSTISICPQCRVVVCGGWDGTIRLVDWHKMRLLGVFRSFKSSVRTVSFSANGGFILSGSDDANCIVQPNPYFTE